ncbi:hypothetical protein KNH48_10120 [Heyndrickxia coagulans]|nr:hypothetical protein KNH48_10120 [Heyndrickxia coagulans]
MIRGACLVYQDGRTGILQVQCRADFAGNAGIQPKGHAWWTELDPLASSAEKKRIRRRNIGRRNTRLASAPPAWFFGMKWARLKILIVREKAGF